MPKSQNRHKALAALLESASVADAAKHCGLAEATLYRYLGQEDFQCEYRALRRQIVERSISQLQGLSGDAIKALSRNLSCGNPNAEIRAASIVLENAFKGVETLDILDRLESLEKRITTEKAI